MSNTTTTPTPTHVGRAHLDQGDRPRRLTTETKASYKTTEFFVYLASVAGVLIASNILGASRDSSDFFSGDKAWFYVTLLSIGYMISRGLAKAGSRDAFDAYDA